jgi:hypothetical protein
MTPRNLLFTIALDPPGCTLVRTQGKLFALSALRSGYEGNLIIFSNGTGPLFPHGRAGVEEIRLETGEATGLELAEVACALKYRARDFIDTPEQYERILFTDCDCLILNDPTPLFDYEEDIVWVGEPGKTIGSRWHRGYFTPDELVSLSYLQGINAGTFSIKGSRFLEVADAMISLMAGGAWEPEFVDAESLPQKVLWGDQPGWNRLAHLGGWTNTAFRPGQVMMPLLYDFDYHCYTKAALVHFVSATMETKLKMQFGLYVGHFYGEAAPILLDLMEI